MTFVPDHSLDDTTTDAKDVQDLRDEATRTAMIDEMLSEDGDLSAVVDRLISEGCAEVAEFMRAYRSGYGMKVVAHKLAVRIDSILESVVDEDMEALNNV